MTALEKIRQKMRENRADPDDLDTTPKVVTRRLKRLYALQKQLTAGNDIARRDLKNALTQMEWESFENECEYLNSTVDFLERPAELDRYLDYLRRADFLYNRSQSTKASFQSKRDSSGRNGRERLYYSSEREYEKALIYLDELLQGYNDPSLAYRVRYWLDRDVDMTPGYEPFIDQVGMPRVKGSRSHYCLDRDIKSNKYDQKRQAKQQAVDNAIRVLQKYISKC